MKEVVADVGVNYRTLQESVTWYHKGGVAEVLSRRHWGHGGPNARLTLEQEAALKEWTSQGECWTIWDAVERVKQTFDATYTHWGMRWVFARLDLKKKEPRRVAPQASAEEQEAWKKGAWQPS